ncbi:hypothetical protein [Methylobacterium sp. D54C]
MARWNVRAQVIDTGVVEMGSEFVIHNGVKVVMPDGKRHFLGRVIMHNEIDSLFRETQGELVHLFLSGRGEGHMALLYGLKTNHEDAYRKESPFAPAKMALVLAGLCGLPLCLLLVGFPLVAVCWLVFMHYRRWDPPAKASFEKHAVNADPSASASNATLGRWAA